MRPLDSGHRYSKTIGMKMRAEIQKELHRLMPTLAERFKVKRIGLFGSFVRGEQTESSDVDVLVEFAGPVGWEFIDLKDFLEEKLGRKVDLVTVPALRPRMRDRILAEVSFA